MKWLNSPKFYSPLANWPWFRISPQSSLYVIYCLILTAWQWLMSFACIPVQIESNKSPLRKGLLALLWEISHLSSPSRSWLGRLILIRGRLRTLQSEPPHSLVVVTFCHSPPLRGYWHVNWPYHQSYFKGEKDIFPQENQSVVSGVVPVIKIKI